MAAIVIALTVLCVALFHLKSGHPTPLYLTLNVLYSLVAAVFGGWLTAKLARRAPIAHGIALALLMLVLNALSYKGGSAGWQPLWYRIFLTVGPPLAAIVGAALLRSR